MLSCLLRTCPSLACFSYTKMKNLLSCISLPFCVLQGSLGALLLSTALLVSTLLCLPWTGLPLTYFYFSMTAKGYLSTSSFSVTWERFTVCIILWLLTPRLHTVDFLWTLVLPHLVVEAETKGKVRGRMIPRMTPVIFQLLCPPTW